MAPKYTFRERVRYAFDNSISRSPLRILLWLGGAAAVIVLLFSGILWLLRVSPLEEPGFFNVFWNILFQALTPNPVDPKDQSKLYLLVMLLVTFVSLFMVSILIGALSSTIEEKIAELRKGRSRVLESDHTVIFGWNPQIFTVISELVTANENRRQGAVIVVMAEQDKVEMEDAIRERAPNTKNTRVICRSGNPIDLNDIEIASPHAARSIIILPEGDDPDAHIIKAVLALTNNPNRRAEPYHIVTQIHEPKNMDVVRMIGKSDHVQPILTSDLIARVVAQTSRQSGLSMVYTELMNFGGDEIYFQPEPALVGGTYGKALLSYEDSAVMGLQRADGTVLLNPPGETDVREGDSVIAISADDDTVRLAPKAGEVDPGAFQQDRKRARPAPEKCLILGWNSSGATIIRELDAYVPKGSQVTVVSELPNLGKQIREQTGKLLNQKVVTVEGDPTDRAVLEKLNAPDFNHVIVLAYDNLDPQETDAKTLVTLLHLRDIAGRDETPFSIVSEMLDLRNRALAEAAKVDDFIVSEHLVSLLMAQLSENRNLLPVFTDIFDPEGSEIYLKPVGEYVQTGKPVNFYTVMAAAQQRDETAIGYRLMREAGDASKSYGVHTNPKKSELVTFAPEDKVIVFAEN